MSEVKAPPPPPAAPPPPVPVAVAALPVLGNGSASVATLLASALSNVGLRLRPASGSGSSSSCVSELMLFLGDPVTEMLSLSNPASILLLLLLLLLSWCCMLLSVSDDGGGDPPALAPHTVGCTNALSVALVVVVGEPSGLVVLCAAPTVANCCCWLSVWRERGRNDQCVFLSRDTLHLPLSPRSPPAAALAEKPAP